MAPGRRRPHRPAQPVGQTVAAGAAEDEGGRAWRGALDPRLPPLASIPLPTHPPTHPPARPPTPHRRRRCGRMPRTRTQTHAWGGSTRQSSPRCSSRRPRDVSARRRPPGDCLRGRGGAAGGLRLTAGGGGGPRGFGRGPAMHPHSACAQVQAPWPHVLPPSLPACPPCCPPCSPRWRDAGAAGSGARAARAPGSGIRDGTREGAGGSHAARRGGGHLAPRE